MNPRSRHQYTLLYRKKLRAQKKLNSFSKNGDLLMVQESVLDLKTGLFESKTCSFSAVTLWTSKFLLEPRPHFIDPRGTHCSRTRLNPGNTLSDYFGPGTRSTWTCSLESWLQTGEQVCNPRSPPTQGTLALSAFPGSHFIKGQVSYDMDGSAAFGEP